MYVGQMRNLAHIIFVPHPHPDFLHRPLAYPCIPPGTTSYALVWDEQEGTNGMKKMFLPTFFRKNLEVLVKCSIFAVWIEGGKASTDVTRGETEAWKGIKTTSDKRDKNMECSRSIRWNTRINHEEGRNDRDAIPKGLWKTTDTARQFPHHFTSSRLPTTVTRGMRRLTHVIHPADKRHPQRTERLPQQISSHLMVTQPHATPWRGGHRHPCHPLRRKGQGGRDVSTANNKNMIYE